MLVSKYFSGVCRQPLLSDRSGFSIHCGAWQISEMHAGEASSDPGGHEFEQPASGCRSVPQALSN